MWHEALTVLHKEWTDMIRDRRALMAAFTYAILGPVVLSVAVAALAERENAVPAKTIEVPPSPGSRNRPGPVCTSGMLRFRNVANSRPSSANTRKPGLRPTSASRVSEESDRSDMPAGPAPIQVTLLAGSPERLNSASPALPSVNTQSRPSSS